MAEISFLPPSTDLMSAASGTPVAPAAGAVDGGFSGLLAQRLQPPAETAQVASAADARAIVVPPDGASKAARTNNTQGQPSPQTGKALPTDTPEAETAADSLEAQTPMAPLAVAGETDAATPMSSLVLLSLTGGESAEQASGLLIDSAATDPEAAVLIDANNPAAVLSVAGATAQQSTDIAVAVPGETEVPDPARQRLSQERLLSQTALQLAKLETGEASASRTPTPQLAASLGLNANGELASQLSTQASGQFKGTAAALSAEQMMRAGVGDTTGPTANQALVGESLSKQFQQQIDRMLASSRGSVSEVSALNASLLKPATDSLTGVASDTPLNVALPGMDVRPSLVSAPLSAVTVPVSTGVGQPGWSADLGQRMVWLANQDIREAQIQLNPRHLGPIDVRIVYSDSHHLSVSFNAQNPAAREALDAALPRLREMFEQQGMNLADANVFDGNASQQFFSEQRQHAENSGYGVDEGFADMSMSDVEQLPLRDPSVPIGLGMLDTFA